MMRPIALPEEYARLIASDRVSGRTRTALLGRGQPDDPAYRPAALSPGCYATLRALVDRILPQTGDWVIDIAQRLDAMLVEGIGDGWRFADLPPDRDAYELGLAALDGWAHAVHGAGFAALNGAAQDAMLSDLAAGRAPGGGPLGPPQLARWFEDARADAARLYVAHPATLARMGYSGIGYGGDVDRLPGFHGLEPGTREAWEPVPAAKSRP